MNLENIHPFIRRAFILNIAPEEKNVKNADCRLFYVLEGSGEITIDGITQSFESNAMGLWMPGTEYCWNVKKSNVCKLAVINFDYTQDYKDITEMLPLVTEPYSDGDTFLKTTDFSDPAFLNKPIFLNNMHVFRNEIEDIVSEFIYKKLYSIELSSNMLKQLIIKISRFMSSSVNAENKIEPLLQYIREHYSDDISNKSLGEMVNYHPHYVNALMKEYTGTTLHSYLSEIRLEKALKYIVNTDESIESIAFRVGYKNPTHFCTAFKKKYGLSPATYRKTSKLI